MPVGSYQAIHCCNSLWKQTVTLKQVWATSASDLLQQPSPTYSACTQWPRPQRDLCYVKWFCNTCHECQLRTMRKVLNPPTISTPAPLFFKIFMDTMLLPKHSGYTYDTEGHCSLIGVEGQALQAETGKTIGQFIFEEFLC